MGGGSLKRKRKFNAKLLSFNDDDSGKVAFQPESLRRKTLYNPELKKTEPTCDKGRRQDVTSSSSGETGRVPFNRLPRVQPDLETEADATESAEPLTARQEERLAADSKKKASDRASDDNGNVAVSAAPIADGGVGALEALEHHGSKPRGKPLFKRHDGERSLCKARKRKAENDSDIVERLQAFRKKVHESKGSNLWFTHKLKFKDNDNSGGDSLDDYYVLDSAAKPKTEFSSEPLSQHDS